MKGLHNGFYIKFMQLEIGLFRSLNQFLDSAANIGIILVRKIAVGQLNI